ncbi:MAG: HNH endonuclease [Gemmatimonadetes bacterium]|nr:HNH endonuclease [Gemmatimonadota bacterium]
MNPELDASVRNAAFGFLNEQRLIRGGESLPYKVLTEGFLYEGRRVPLMGPQGIFKPAVLPDMPLSITTVPVVLGRERPYQDELGADGLLRYRYRGVDPGHRDNRGLVLAMERQAPLVYLHGVVPGWYIPAYPVFIVGADPASLTFTVAVDQQPNFVARPSGQAFGVEENLVRSYVTRVTMHRIHQHAFRQRVLLAYQERCAICSLKHHELLEASHILPDGDPRGEPVLPNGIALCNLHHAAFDRHVLGIRPDLTVDLRLDILHESDGPMLRHGLQGFQGARVSVPRPTHQQPNREFLEERYALFRKAS